MLSDHNGVNLEINNKQQEISKHMAVRKHTFT